MYIYKYSSVKSNKVYYIGQTNDLIRRDKEHYKEDVWCYKNLKLEYIECNDSIANDIEGYFIQKYKPLFNKNFPHFNIVSEMLSLENESWNTFERKL